MRLFTNGKKMLLAMAALVCAGIAQADTKTFVLSYGDMTLTQNGASSDGYSHLTGNDGTDAAGCELTQLRTGKDYSGASDFTIDGTTRKSIKVSNGAQNRCTLPEGWFATKVTFYSYVNGTDNGTDCYWKEVGGVNYTAETTTIFSSFKDTSNPDIVSFDLDEVSEFTFTNAGLQNCFVAFVEAKDQGLTYEITTGNNPENAGTVKVIQKEVDETTVEVTVTATPNGGYVFSEWQDKEGNTLSTENPYVFNTTTNTEVIAVYESTALSIGEETATVVVKHVYDVTGCVTKGDNQLIDSSHEGDYVKFDVIPTVSGKYSFTSMIGTKQDGVSVTLGYIDSNGDFIESEKKAITNSGNWDSGEDYTWEFDLEEANKLYTFKILCHTTNGGYCVNVFEMDVVRIGDVTPTYTVTYSLGDEVAEGVVPAKDTAKEGKTVTVPANFTLYKEGHTLTGWTDGTKTYTAGNAITVNSDLTLTPVFTENSVSLDERTEDVTLTWDFQRQNGAPTVGWEGTGNDSRVWVTQTQIGNETIDVKMGVNAANGKVANANWEDWAQINNGTILSIPICTGATVGLVSYSATTTTTIADETINQETTTPTYTYTGTESTANIVIGDGSYWRTVTVTLPALHLTIDDNAVECADFAPYYTHYATITYNRQFQEDYYYLMVLPFAPDATSLENYSFYKLSSVADDAVTFAEETAPEANTPYLCCLKEGATVTNSITGGPTTVSTEVNDVTAETWTLIGSLTNKTVNSTTSADNYLLHPINKTLHKVKSTLTVYPYTAYLQNQLTGTAAAPTTMRLFISGPTGIKEISVDRVVGLGTGCFDLQGRPITKPMKGQIYIKDGKKIMR